MTRFTVLLPVHRPPVLIPHAVAGVLCQTHQDFELFIICDGAPPATGEWARAMAQRDPRVRVFDLPKGERHGEAHRHTTLGDATGTLVAQIADDDLWFPDYLAALGELLATFDFGNLMQINVSPNGRFGPYGADLADPTIRERMLAGTNFFGPTFAGYRLSAYQALPVGWAPAPAGEKYSDLYMWKKFLAHEGLTFGSLFRAEAVHFPASRRRDMSLAQRETEIGAFADRIRNPATRRAIQDKVMEDLRALRK